MRPQLEHNMSEFDQQGNPRPINERYPTADARMKKAIGEAHDLNRIASAWLEWGAGLIESPYDTDLHKEDDDGRPYKTGPDLDDDPIRFTFTGDLEEWGKMRVLALARDNVSLPKFRKVEYSDQCEYHMEAGIGGWSPISVPTHFDDCGALVPSKDCSRCEGCTC